MVSVPTHGLSINSLVHPPPSDGYSHGHDSSTFSFVPRAPFQMYTTGISASEDFIYSSPESSQSPLSEHYGFPHRNSMSSSSSVVDFVPTNCTSPLNNSTASGWAPVLPPSALPATCNTLEDDIHGYSSVSLLVNSAPSLLRLISLPQALPYQYPSPSWTGMTGLSFSESWHQPRDLSRVATMDWRFSTL